MQLTTNTTGLPAALTVAADCEARDHCVVVIKGTFQTSPDGELSLAEMQQPLTTADQHYGEPGSSSVRYECDFALSKPYADVIVVGKAVAPGGEPVRTLPVTLEVQGRVKELRVCGDRHWVAGLAGVRASDPLAFHHHSGRPVVSCWPHLAACLRRSESKSKIDRLRLPRSRVLPYSSSTRVSVEI